MMIASLFEVVSIGAIIPFLGILTAPEQVYQHQMTQPVIQLLQLTSPSQLPFPLTVVFISSVLLAGAIRLFLLYVMTKMIHATGSDLSVNIYHRTLYQNYTTHIARNSSEVINGIITKTNGVVGGVIEPILVMLSSIVLIIAIMIALLSIDIVIALTSLFTFGLLYWCVIIYTRKTLQGNSQCIAEQSTQMVKSLQEGLGGVRDVLIDGTQEFYCKLYRNADISLRKASATNAFIGGSPRFVMEAVGMALIASLAYTISLRETGIAPVIPVIGALALGAQRLLPALQQAYKAYSQIKGSYSSFIDVLNLLEQPLPEYADQPQPKPIYFVKEIKLNNLNFRYTEDSPWILKNVNLSLKKGSRIGFIGVTGSGKSTLIDIVMGLLPPTEGVLIIDNQTINSRNRRAWQAHIAHVPQNIYLSDSTIE